MKLKFAYGIAPGISNIERDTVCQDKVKIVDENGVAVISLAVSSRGTVSSGFSAKLLAETAATLVSERFDELYTSEDDFIRKTVLENIKESFQEVWIKPSGICSALLFVAVKDERYLAGHIGDGLIAGLNVNCTVLSKPNDDLLWDETDFAAEDRVMTNLRIYKGQLQEPFGFMLISDGACHSLYESDTNNLSPACTTFYEWMKEYDGETVSDALVENINKYFLKNTKGDISIAIMVSDNIELDAELAETNEPYDQPETKEAIIEKETDTEKDDSDKGSGKRRRILKYIVIALILVSTVIFAYTLKQPDVTEPKHEDKGDYKAPVIYSSELEPSVTFFVKNPESFDAGEYQVGEDIPAGEYFFWTGDMLMPDSILINGDTCLSGELYCMTIQVNEGDTLTSANRFTAAENVNPIKATKGILLSGKYKIGKDIAAGKYIISLINKNTEGRYYSVLDGEISNDMKFSDETSVQVPEEGYVIFYNSVLAVDQN